MKKLYKGWAKLLVWIVLFFGAALMGIGAIGIMLGMGHGIPIEEQLQQISYEESVDVGAYLMTQTHEAAGQIMDAELKNVSKKKNMKSYIVQPQGGTNALIYIQNLDKKELYTNVEAWKDAGLENVLETYHASPEYQADGREECYYMLEVTENGGKVQESHMSDGARWTIENETVGKVLNALGSPEEYQIFIALNTTYPVKASDAFDHACVYDVLACMNEAAPLELFYLFFVGLVIVLVMLVVMGFQAGHDSKTGELKMNAFDKFPLEVWIVIDLLAVAGFFGLLIEGYSYSVDYGKVTSYGLYESNMSAGHLFASLVPFTIAAFAVLAAMVAQAEIVILRRIKSDQFGGSIIKSIVLYVARGGMRALEDIERDAKSNHRLIARHIIFALCNLFFCGFFGAAASHDYGGVAFFLFLVWVIFNGLVLRHRVKNNYGKDEIKAGLREIAKGNMDYQIDMEGMSLENREISEHVNRVRDGLKLAVDERMKTARLRTDLIANVSHDLRTPLTSIINYVDLLKRENIQDEKIAGYIEVLDRKSARLKTLTNDLIEASKISSGNITLDMQDIDLGQLIKQVNGEFEDKFEEKNLNLIVSLPDEPMIVRADGRQMFRVLENLYNNVAKYAMPGTRVYANAELIREGIHLKKKEEADHKQNGGMTTSDSVLTSLHKVRFSIKNISEQQLNVTPDELMERFVRGDDSRTTEGSGLGLEIARNLISAQGGSFELHIEGDLFAVEIEL